jgi:hypothetical protein
VAQAELRSVCSVEWRWRTSIGWQAERWKGRATWRAPTSSATATKSSQVKSRQGKSRQGKAHRKRPSHVECQGDHAPSLPFRACGVRAWSCAEASSNARTRTPSNRSCQSVRERASERERESEEKERGRAGERMTEQGV